MLLDTEFKSSNDRNWLNVTNIKDEELVSKGESEETPLVRSLLVLFPSHFAKYHEYDVQNEKE